MSTTKQSKLKPILAKIWPYFLVAAAVLGVVFVGSRDKASDAPTSLNMATVSANDYQVSADQITQLYVVANVSNAMNLASTDVVSSNYVTVSVMQGISQTDADKLEKPNIVDTSGITRGVQVYTVSDGETMDSIAKKFGLTTDQIRWSNGLKTADVIPGQVLNLPSVAGIVYTVKAGDTLDSIVDKTGTTRSAVISVNDLEADQTLAEGRQLVLPGGFLPATERPEYVAPASRGSRRNANANTFTYTYFGSTSDRQGMHTVSEALTYDGNPYVRGQCTWYAWWWRKAHGMALPGNTWGNARTWAANARAAGYNVNRTPGYGAVFHTASGYYGHVGVVTGLNADGSITVREMNYGTPYRITESIIPANLVGNFSYIH